MSAAEEMAQAPLDAVQVALKCPSCGGNRRWDPTGAGLRCESCGMIEAVEAADPALGAREITYDDDIGAAEPPEIHHAHRCETCGGEVVFVGRAVSDHCPYCDGPVVLEAGHAHFAPSGVIPFFVDRDAAEANIADWVRARWAAPGDLLSAVEAGRMAAVYAPFWTFDATKDIQYTARKRRGSGKRGRWVSVSGFTRLNIDDMITPASDHVTPAIRDGIMHGFGPSKLRPYAPAYLAGFAAELHGQKVAEGLKAMRKDVEVLVTQAIRRDIGGGRISNIRYEVEISGVRFRRILLPLWIRHYGHGGRKYRIVVSGIDGRTFGERPYSRAKLAAYSAALSVPAFLIGVGSGAVMAPL